MVTPNKARALFDEADKKFNKAVVSRESGRMTQENFEKHIKDYATAIWLLDHCDNGKFPLIN